MITQMKGMMALLIIMAPAAVPFYEYLIISFFSMVLKLSSLDYIVLVLLCILTCFC